MPDRPPPSAHARALARAAEFLATTTSDRGRASDTRPVDGARASVREARKARPNVNFLGNALRAIASANARTEVKCARAPLPETAARTREEGVGGEERDGGEGKRKRERKRKRKRKDREERRRGEGDDRKRAKSAFVVDGELSDGEEEGEIR